MNHLADDLTNEPNLERWLQHLIQQGIELWVEGEQLRIRAPQGVLTPELRVALRVRKAELVARLQSLQQHNTPLPTVIEQPAERYAPFPLTEIQHAYWVGSNTMLELGGVGIHYYAEIACEDLAMDALNAALNALVTRHEMLRAIILPDGQQQILAQVPSYTIATLDCRGQDAAEQAQRQADLRTELSHQNLPTDQWPPFDIRALLLDKQRTTLYVSLSLLAFDFLSCLILFEEWFALYQDRTRTLPHLDLSFRDYVLAEKQIEASPLYEQSRAYWLARLDTLPPAPVLPLAQLPAALTQPTFHRHRFQLARPQWTQLKQQAEQLGVSPTSLLLAAFSQVLATWGKSPAFTLNLTLFQRQPLHPQVNQIIGDFTTINLLAIDTEADPVTEATQRQPLSISKLAQRVQRQLWQDLDHNHFSGVAVLRELMRRNPQAAGSAIMPIVFTSGIGLTQQSSDFLGFGENVYELSQTPQVMLDHVVAEGNGALLMHWDVVADLFPPGLIEAMFEANCTLLTRLVTEADLWHELYPVRLPQAQVEQRKAVNATAQPLIAPGSPDLLHTLFLHQVAAHADEPAVITSTQTLSYRTVAQRAQQVARWLRQRGAAPNTLVAVVMEKGWEQVVAVLGIHWAGAAYLPIDPELPTDRQHYLLAQGEVRLIVTQPWLEQSLIWPDYCAPHDRLAIDACFEAIQDADSDTLRQASGLIIDEPALINQPTDIAYVIYTSGSTGHPKGVVIDHQGAVNTILDLNQRYGVTAGDRVLAISALNFDLSVYDIFGLLAAGGALVIPDAQRRIDPQHWHELMVQHGVTLWNTVPALMQILVDYLETQPEDQKIRRQGPVLRVATDDRKNGAHPFIPSSLQLVMMSGDWIPVTLPNRIKTLWPQTKVYSLGGATEASIWSIDYPIEAVDPAWTSIPYGRPLANQTFEVLDAHLNPRPVWVPGDLYIGGIGLALGYWKDEAKTNERFITHPQTGERLYKTGDLGRYIAIAQDGLPDLEFLGRADFQVKIRGHRIELGEIEATLLQHDLVKETVVHVVGEAKETNKQLVAYVVRKENNTEAPDQIPDRYGEEASPGVLTDPIDRMTFKLSQPGLRPLNGEVRFDLPEMDANDALRRAYLARQSYRQFTAVRIPLAQLGRLLGNLRQLKLDTAPLPKYLYPSAGSLYPVQTYLYVKAGRVEQLAEGYYYYQPATHQLVRLHAPAALAPPHFVASNQQIFAQAAFALFLVGQLDAITPMYGEMARDFCLLEAGYMSQLLMMQATEQQLGLCPIGGGLQETALRHALHLGERQLLLHSLVGGRIDPIQMTQWLQPMLPLQANTWQADLRTFLQTKLPAYMLPTVFVELDALPLSANGKVDRRALPVPELHPTHVERPIIAPRTPIEEQIAEIWCQILNDQTPSVDQDFFEVGGDSLTATRFLARLRQTFAVELSLRTIFAHPTIAQLAGIIEAQSLTTVDPALLEAAMAELLETA